MGKPLILDKYRGYVISVYDQLGLYVARLDNGEIRGRSVMEVIKRARKKIDEYA